MSHVEERDPSTLALDAYWASGRAPDARIERHLDTCARCSTYLRELDALHETARAAPIPPLLEESGEVAERRSDPRALRPRRALGVAPVVVGLAAVAALVALLSRATLPSRPAYVAAKGAPAVDLLVRRGAATRLWDGRSAVRPGDALALRVACESAKHVAVAAKAEPAWKVLAEVDCPAQGDVLPFTLVVDDAPGEEDLAVVLSPDAMSEERVRAAVADSQRADDAWVVDFALPKETDQ
jgi:hypothetical protein